MKMENLESALSYFETYYSPKEEKTPLNQAFALGQTMSALKLALRTMQTQKKQLEEMAVNLGKPIKDNYFLKQLQQYDKTHQNILKRKLANHAGGDCKNFSLLDTATLIKKIKENTKENNACRFEIQNVTTSLNNIKDSEEQVENASLLQAFALGRTMTCVQIALKNLQEICDAQDTLINDMAEELKNRENGPTILKIPHFSDPCKFNSQLIQTKETHTRICKCGKCCLNSKNLDLTGFEITDVNKITDDSIIIKWQPPGEPVIGFEIFINGIFKSTVLNPFRTCAIVQSVNLAETMYVTIYAITKCGKIPIPATALKYPF